MTKFWNLNADMKTPDSLEALFREYQVHALNIVWAHPEGVVSREVWAQISTMLAPTTISRASVINFLKTLVDQDLVKVEERTGKGGYHGVYSPAMKWSELEELIVDRFVEKLRKVFPDILISRMSERMVPA
jgi:predicted transcriptional regulator